MPDLTPRQQAAQIVDGWVKEGSLPEDKRQQYVDLLAGDDKIANSFASSALRHQDYSRKTAEVARQREELTRQAEEERKRLEMEANTQRAEIERLRRAEREKQQLEVELTAYRQMANDYGWEGNRPAALQNQTPPSLPAPAPAAPVAQPTGGQQVGTYLTRQEAGAAMQEWFALQGQANQVSAEHFKLFGQPLEDDVLNEALAARRPVREYWETKFNVPAKRAELAEVARQRDREAMRAELKAELMTEYGQNPLAVMGNGVSPAVTEKNLVFDTYVKNRMDGFKPAAPAPSAGQATSGVSNVTGQPAPRVVPEQVPGGIAGHNDRVMQAVREYNSTFDIYGNPLNRK